LIYTTIDIFFLFHPQNYENMPYNKALIRYRSIMNNNNNNNTNIHELYIFEINWVIILITINIFYLFIYFHPQDEENMPYNKTLRINVLRTHF